MKRKSLLLFAVIVLFLTGCIHFERDDCRDDYYLLNETGKELVIDFPPARRENPSSDVENASYYYMFSYYFSSKVAAKKGCKTEFCSFNQHFAITITMDGVTYIDNGDDKKGCLWNTAYDDATQEEIQSISKNHEIAPYGTVKVFHLTEEYIKNLPVVE